MKAIKFNDREIHVPTAWNEITIKQQIEAEKIQNTQKHIKNMGIMAAYTGIPLEELREAPVPSLLNVVEALSFIDTPISTEPLFQFTYRGEEYNVSDTIIKQQWQDYVAAQTAIAEYEEDIWTQLSYLLAIMAKRSGETLNNFDVNERALYMQGVDVETCQRVASFFLSNQKVSEYISVLSSPAVVELSLENKFNELSLTLNQLKKQRGGNFAIRLWIGVIKMWIRFSKKEWAKSSNSQVSNNSKKNWKQTCKRLLLKKQTKKDKGGTV